MFEFVTKFFPFSKWCSSTTDLYPVIRFRSRWKFWKKRSLTINKRDLTYQVTYLGNVPTFWSKGDECIENPLNILWRNYEKRKGKKAQTKMKITICNSGMKAYTREVGQVEYWSNKITYVTNVSTHPRVFIWIYRHTGKRGKPELRCHAVLCKESKHAKRMADELRVRLYNALREFRREIHLRQNTVNNLLPTRKKFLVKGASYFKQPLERTQSAPKLDSIVEEDHEQIESESFNNLKRSLYFVSTGQLNF